MAARAGFEPATLWTKGVESTNEPPRPTTIIIAKNAAWATNVKMIDLLVNCETNVVCCHFCSTVR